MNREDLSEQDWDLLIRVLEGKVGEQDPRFQYWLAHGENRRSYFQSIRTKWKKAKDRQQFYEGKKEEMWQAVSLCLVGHQERKPAIWLSYAAVALVLLGISFLLVVYTGQRAVEPNPIAWQERTTETGQIQRIQLEDGSLMVLQPLSTVRYPRHFSDSSRAIYLSGAAYFEVSKEAKIPFEVHASNLNVKVLGTRFQVENYADEDQERVFLLDGRVKVVQVENGTSEILQPGQAIALEKDRDALQWLEEPWTEEDVLSWKEGRLTFREATWAEIDRQLYRHGGIRLINRSAYGQLHYTGNATLARLRELLDDMAFVTGLQYHYEGKQVVFTDKKSDSR